MKNKQIKNLIFYGILLLSIPFSAMAIEVIIDGLRYTPVENQEEMVGGRTSSFWKTYGGKYQTITDKAVNITGDLEFQDEIKPDGATCSAGQILKKTGADNWDCAADATGGGAGDIAQLGQIGDVSTTTLATGYTLHYDGSNWVSSSTPYVDASTGNVGIGTTSPAYKLDVNGDIRADGDIWTTGKFYGDYWISSTGNSMNMQPTGDTDDFFSFKTPSHRPTIKREGGKFVYFESSNVYDVGISFRDDDTYSGTLNYEKDGHIMTMLGKASPLGFKANSDYDDYILIQTVNNIPELTVASSSGLKINAGGTNALLLNHDGGYVGIGKTNPATVLDVNGTITSPTLLGGTLTTSDLTLQTTSGVGATGADMHFLVGNNGATEAMTILNNGRVGIGTSEPVDTLHVVGQGSFGNSVTASNSNRALNLISTDAMMKILRVHPLYGAGLELITRATADGADTAYWDIYTDATDSDLNIRDRFEGLNDRLTIQHTTGKVGIGDTSPNQLLSLKGTNAQISIEESDTEFLRMGVGETASTSIIGWDDADALQLGLYSSPTDTTIDSKMTILANGNVEINETLKIGAYTLPNTDGTANYVLKTDGSGALTWQADNDTGGASSIAELNAQFTSESVASTTHNWADAYISNTLTVDGYMQDTDIDTFAELQSWAVGYTDNNTTYVSSDFTLSDITGYAANEHLDWTTDRGAVNIHAGNYTAGLTNLTDFDQTAWRLFYSNNLGDVIELSLGTDGQYLKSQGGTASLTWGVPTDTNTTYLGGTNLTLAGTTFNVDDAFVLHAGDICTGVHDYGGATSFEIPNGTPTIDTIGEIGLDTTSDQLVYFGGAKRVLTYQKEICFALEDPVEADDNIPIFFPRQAITITDVYCQVDGGTSAQLIISDGTNVLETILCDADGAEDDGSIANGTFTSLERMEFDIGTIVGTNTWLNGCITYVINSD